MSCLPRDESTVGVQALIWTQFAVGLLAFVTGTFWWGSTAPEPVQSEEPADEEQIPLCGAASEWRKEWRSLVHARKLADQCSFVDHVRCERNFCRDVKDSNCQRPPPAPCGMSRPTVFSRYALYRCFFRQEIFLLTLLRCFGLACLSGSLGTGLWLMKYEAATGRRLASEVTWIDTAGDGWQKVRGDYVFFPIFMVFGLMVKVVGRYTDMISAIFSVNGKIKSVGQEVGGRLKSADLEARRLCFKLYRYLNVYNAMVFSSINPDLPRQLEQFRMLGLLTPTEITYLEPMKNKKADTLLTWLSAVVLQLQGKGAIKSTFAPLEMTLPALRSATAGLSIVKLKHYPNMWISVLRLAIDLYVLVDLVGLPFRLLMFNATSLCEGGESITLQSWQYLPMIDMLLLSTIFLLSFDVINVLSSPHANPIDFISTNSFLCDTEQTIFSTLRGLFMSNEELEQTFGSAREPLGFNELPTKKEETHLANLGETLKGFDTGKVVSVPMKDFDNPLFSADATISKKEASQLLYRLREQRVNGEISQDDYLQKKREIKLLADDPPGTSSSPSDAPMPLDFVGQVSPEVPHWYTDRVPLVKQLLSVMDVDKNGTVNDAELCHYWSAVTGKPVDSVADIEDSAVAQLSGQSMEEMQAMLILRNDPGMLEQQLDILMGRKRV